MPHYLSDEELKRTSPAETDSFRSPVPTQIVLTTRAGTS